MTVDEFKTALTKFEQELDALPKNCKIQGAEQGIRRITVDDKNIGYIELRSAAFRIVITSGQQ